MFWSRSMGRWVERDDATLYGEEVWHFPPRELPVGGRGILDVATGLLHTPRVGGGDFQAHRFNS